jgi:hypothetical protein
MSQQTPQSPISVVVMMAADLDQVASRPDMSQTCMIAQT